MENSNYTFAIFSFTLRQFYFLNKAYMDRIRFYIGTRLKLLNVFLKYYIISTIFICGIIFHGYSLFKSMSQISCGK